jgi:phosphoglycerol transferase MdoB-like AlkP superfamily enzyme
MWLRLRMLLVFLAALMVVLTAWRVVFWLTFSAAAGEVAKSTLARAFYLGFKFDLRLALLLIAPFLLLGAPRAFDASRSLHARRFWINHFALLAVLLSLFHAIDIGNYAYLKGRLDASALRYFRDPLISLRMVWESYPVVWGFIGLLLLGIILRVAFERSMPRPLPEAPAGRPARPWQRWVLGAAVGAAYIAGLYGKASYYPLRWSDAFFTTQTFVSDLAVNPVLLFANTLAAAEGERAYDVAAFTARFDRVAHYLGVELPNRESLSLARYVRPLPLGSGRLNVVLIFLESFGAHQLGAFGNQLNPSPSFDSIAKESLLFRRFYTPRGGTARGVFATLTGIPDAQTFRTASRNPRTITQNTVLNSFAGYRKFYFLGGSASWANIRALFSHNLKDLEIYEEGSFKEARVDVWGIPDYYLFEEANRVLRNVTAAPFFAFIHLSGNHRPYTIPKDIPGFELRTEDQGALLDHGFESLEEFNSFRLLDFSLGHFFELARREAYWGNTVFAITSDNGGGGHNHNLPGCDDALRIVAYHAPFAICAPRLIAGGRVSDDMATQMDILPTLASIAGVSALNTTLGRNLLDPQATDPGVSFIYRTRGPQGEIVLVDHDWTLVVDPDGSNSRLYRCGAEGPVRDAPEQAQSMYELALGLYQASKFLAYNNAPVRYEAEDPATLRGDSAEGATRTVVPPAPPPTRSGQQAPRGRGDG